jgi:hypothetical protein
VDDTVPGGEVPRSDLNLAEIVRTIETNGCWVVLPIHDVPSYAAFFEELFATVTRALPEQGYLLQLSGTKQVSIGDFPDSEVALREVERFCAGGHRNIADLPHDAETFELTPGEGVHVPALVPHLVKDASERLPLALGRL